MSLQVIINILFSFSVFLIISLGFNIIYLTTKFFHIVHAISITLGAYFYYMFASSQLLPVSISFVFSILLVIFLNVVIEYYIYRPLRGRNCSSYVFLIAALGMYAILQNIISLIWGDSIKSIRTGIVKVGHEIMGAHITDIQIVTICISLLLFISTIIFFNKANLGRQIKAVSANEVMSSICGINSNSVIMYSFAIGSALASVAGMLVAFDRDMIPTMGFNLLLYGIIAMIIGGVGSTWGLIGGSLLLATSQHLGAYFIDSKWMDAIAYLILILFLIWKPLGFSGNQLKKVEI